MFKKLLSVITLSSILLASSSLTFAQTQRSWAAVENLVNQEIAVKTRSDTKYGIIKSADADSLVLQLAGNKSLTQNEVTINRNDVQKIWRALLFVNDRNTAKGALIGAGVGAVVVGVPAVAGGRDENDIGANLAAAGFFLGALGGAAVGGIAGFFAKTKHKKRDLVYKQ
ncbi:MAG: hypothetical protein ACR2MD_02130 [Aridibacter sp.]